MWRLIAKHPAPGTPGFAQGGTTISKLTSSLPIPGNFNAETCLLSKTTENGVFHESRQGAAFAARLVANGTPQDLALAEKVLDAVLRCQERRKGDPHRGNFLWMAEDDVVEDLNAVEFNLERLIPMMIRHSDRLPPKMQARVREAICLGLDEIRRLDVLVAYSNITVLDVVNSCLGGELLQDARTAARGYGKLVEWMAFTDRHGIPFEYNSPTYTAVVLRALKLLADLVQHEETRIRTRTMAARLGLSVGLHIHPRTGRWAGPHSRAYQPTVVCETRPELELLEEWVTNGTVPTWVADVVRHRPQALEVVETAFPERDMGITTYHSPSFALGVSAQGAGGQSNAMMIHYHRNVERAGVMYTRYLTNDKWLGDFYHATDRTKSRNLIEEGRFYGVQSGPRAIGLYTPSRLDAASSATATLIWTGRELVDEIWIGERRPSALPAQVAPGEVVVVGSGDALMAVLPLTHTDLGRDAPIRLVEMQGDLVLEIYNYLGAEKRFWEMNWPGAFYQGTTQCGAYLEVAERTDYADGRAFARAVAAGKLGDVTAAPFVYAGEGERLWTVEYARDGQSLGIEVDLMAWSLKRRWTQNGELGWPMLESPVARETQSGRVAVGEAILTCGDGAAWLFACPEARRWVAAYHGLDAAPLTLTVPDGAVEIEAMGTGTLVWDAGRVTVEAIDLAGVPQVTGGQLATWTRAMEGAPTR